MKQLVALFDMDDTLCDTSGQRARDLMKISEEGAEIISDFRDPRCKLYVQRQLKLIMSQPGWWENLPKLNDGFELYNLAKEEGFETQLLSKAPETYDLAWTEKKRWRDKYAQGSKLTLTEDKSRYDGEILFDDWTPYVTAWLESHPEGRAVLPSRDWNFKYKHKRATTYTRDNIEEIRAILREIKEGKAKL